VKQGNPTQQQDSIAQVRLLSVSCSRDPVSFSLQGFCFSIFDSLDRNNPPLQGSRICVQMTPLGIATPLFGFDLVVRQYLLQISLLFFGKFKLSFNSFAVHV
jgi:hypothetical protein